MKTNADVASGWVRKAREDILSMIGTSRVGAWEGCCFHAQQVAEKMLKAFLVTKERDFPFTHNLEKLLELAASDDPAFLKFQAAAETLTPYAVELRYDQDRRSTRQTARTAGKMARNIFRFVHARLPANVRGPKLR